MLKSERKLAIRASNHLEQAMELLGRTGLEADWKRTQWREKAYQRISQAQTIIGWELYRKENEQ